MLPLFACLLATQVPVGQPPRLRTFLPNGATVLVERVPEAKSLSVQLFVAARTAPESVQTNGRRHLLEHILARGTRGDLDRRLETMGAFLNAHTMRDAMQFEVSLPPGQLKLGLAAIEETMHMPEVTTQVIQHEAAILTQEGALRDADDKLSAAAWSAAYGDQGLDPFGNLDVIRNTTPAELTELHRRMYVGSGLVISIAGDVDLDEATAQAEEILKVIPAGEPVLPNGRRQASVADVSLRGAGDARAASVPSFLSPKSAWVLAAGLSVAATIPNSFVTYTPTTRYGLVIVGQTDGEGIGRAFDSADPKQLVAYGRRLARAWVERQLHDPAAIAALRGMLLVQSPGLKPEAMLENLDAMREDQFEEGLQAFQRGASAGGPR
jgi:hypothetical protein